MCTRPDRWGERVIRFLDKPLRLSVLEFLYFAGDKRFGALGVSTQQTHYAPRVQHPLPVLQDVSRPCATSGRTTSPRPASRKAISIPGPLRRSRLPARPAGGVAAAALITLLALAGVAGLTPPRAVYYEPLVNRRSEAQANRSAEERKRKCSLMNSFHLSLDAWLLALTPGLMAWRFRTRRRNNDQRIVATDDSQATRASVRLGKVC